MRFLFTIAAMTFGIGLTVGTEAVVESAQLNRPFAESPSLRVCGHCHFCVAGSVGMGHDFHVQEDYGLESYVGSHECFAFDLCDSNVHPGCGSGPVMDEAIELALRLERGDTSALGELRSRFGDQTSVDGDRLLISSRCSPEYIIALIPLGGHRYGI